MQIEVRAMKKAGAYEFRSNMKKWLNAAKREPVMITRKNKEVFVLMTYEQFFNMANMQFLQPRGLPSGKVRTVVQFQTTQ